MLPRRRASSASPLGGVWFGRKPHQRFDPGGFAYLLISTSIWYILPYNTKFARCQRSGCRNAYAVNEGSRRIEGIRASFQPSRRIGGTVQVSVPLSREFVRDLQRKGFLADQNAHDRESIGRALAHAARVAISLTRDRDDEA
jgi:hypothetical protein